MCYREILQEVERASKQHSLSEQKNYWRILGFIFCSFFSIGDYPSAYAAALTLEQINPANSSTSTMIQFFLVEAELRIGKPKEALERLTRIKDHLHVNSYLSRLFLGQLLLKNYDFIIKISNLNNIKSIYLTLAHLYKQDINSAWKSWCGLINVEKESPLGLWMKAVLFFKRQLKQEATVSAQHLLKIKPNDATAISILKNAETQQTSLTLPPMEEVIKDFLTSPITF